MEEIKNVELPEEKVKSKPKQTFRTKDCPVKRYIHKDNAIEVDFDGFGLRFEHLNKDYTGAETVKVKYKGTIGKPKFICHLVD